MGLGENNELICASQTSFPNDENVFVLVKTSMSHPGSMMGATCYT